MSISAFIKIINKATNNGMGRCVLESHLPSGHSLAFSHQDLIINSNSSSTRSPVSCTPPIKANG